MPVDLSCDKDSADTFLVAHRGMHPDVGIMTDDGSRQDLYRAQSSPPRTALSPASLTADPRISPSPDALRSGTPQPSQISRRTRNAIRPQHNSMSSPHPDTPQPRSWSSLSSRIRDYLSTQPGHDRPNHRNNSKVRDSGDRMDESFAAGECRWELIESQLRALPAELVELKNSPRFIWFSAPPIADDDADCEPYRIPWECPS